MPRSRFYGASCRLCAKLSRTSGITLRSWWFLFGIEFRHLTDSVDFFVFFFGVFAVGLKVSRGPQVSWPLKGLAILRTKTPLLYRFIDPSLESPMILGGRVFFFSFWSQWTMGSLFWEGFCLDLVLCGASSLISSNDVFSIILTRAVPLAPQVPLRKLTWQWKITEFFK